MDRNARSARPMSLDPNTNSALRAPDQVVVQEMDDGPRMTWGLPAGITAEQLSGPHPSVLRNPLIAETFHRTGAVEVWRRGTNRVIEECRRCEVEVPTFEEQGGTVGGPLSTEAPSSALGDAKISDAAMGGALPLIHSFAPSLERPAHPAVLDSGRRLPVGIGRNQPPTLS